MSLKFTSTFVIAVLLILGTAARAPPELTCNVTRQSDLSFKYELSKPPDYPSCQTQWEDDNKTSIVANSTDKHHIVKDLSNQSVILKQCVQYLHHIRDCLEGYEDVECKVNCSLLSPEEPRPVTVNSTLICISGSCLDQTKVIVFSVIVLVIICIAFGILVGLMKYRRKRLSLHPAVYSPANQEVKFGLGDQEITV